MTSMTNFDNLYEQYQTNCLYVGQGIHLKEVTAWFDQLSNQFQICHQLCQQVLTNEHSTLQETFLASKLLHSMTNNVIFHQLDIQQKKAIYNSIRILLFLPNRRKIDSTQLSRALAVLLIYLSASEEDFNEAVYNLAVAVQGNVGKGPVTYYIIN